MSPPRRWLVGGALTALAAAGCSSGATHSSTAGAAGSSSVPSASSATTAMLPATTVTGQLPTVYDCGGGAFKPETLLVVCGVGSTTVTNVQWTSWTATSASGSGTVNLPGKSPAPASLALSDVVASGGGPQFAQLKATWTGMSPDGHPYDVYPLATAPTK